MKQRNAAIRTKQVKQISDSGPLHEFSRYMFLGSWPFFVRKSFNSEAKGIHKWVQLELGKSKKGRPIINHFTIIEALCFTILLA